MSSAWREAYRTVRRSVLANLVGALTAFGIAALFVVLWPQDVWDEMRPAIAVLIITIAGVGTQYFANVLGELGVERRQRALMLSIVWGVFFVGSLAGWGRNRLLVSQHETTIAGLEEEAETRLKEEDDLRTQLYEERVRVTSLRHQLQQATLPKDADISFAFRNSNDDATVDFLVRNDGESVGQVMHFTLCSKDRWFASDRETGNLVAIGTDSLRDRFQTESNKRAKELWFRAAKSTDELMVSCDGRDQLEFIPEVVEGSLSIGPNQASIVRIGPLPDGWAFEGLGRGWRTGSEHCLITLFTDTQRIILYTPCSRPTFTRPEPSPHMEAPPSQ